MSLNNFFFRVRQQVTTVWLNNHQGSWIPVFFIESYFHFLQKLVCRKQEKIKVISFNKHLVKTLKTLAERLLLGHLNIIRGTFISSEPSLSQQNSNRNTKFGTINYQLHAPWQSKLLDASSMHINVARSARTDMRKCSPDLGYHQGHAGGH